MANHSRPIEVSAADRAELAASSAWASDAIRPARLSWNALLADTETSRPSCPPAYRRLGVAPAVARALVSELMEIAALQEPSWNSERMRFHVMNSSPFLSRWIRPRQTPPS